MAGAVMVGVLSVPARNRNGAVLHGGVPDPEDRSGRGSAGAHEVRRASPPCTDKRVIVVSRADGRAGAAILGA